MKTPSGYFRFIAFLIIGAVVVYSGGNQLSADFNVAEQKIEEKPVEYQKSIDDILAQQQTETVSPSEHENILKREQPQKVIVPQRPPSLNTYQPPSNVESQYATIVSENKFQESLREETESSKESGSLELNDKSLDDSREKGPSVEEPKNNEHPLKKPEGTASASGEKALDLPQSVPSQNSASTGNATVHSSDNTSN